MKSYIYFGEKVDSFPIRVLNNREIRATAGIMFLSASVALLFIMLKGNFVPIKYALSIFVLEFATRLFLNPQYAPLLIIGRIIVSGQNPEYVGAEQKKYAWVIGFSISVIMFFLLVVVNAYSAITGIACLLCLILMFFESAFGICLGCKIYGLIKKDKVQLCPGEICDLKSKSQIVNVSSSHRLILLALVVFVLLLYLFFNDDFAILPWRLF